MNTTLTARPATELPGLDELVAAVRAAVARNAGWRDTASHVADALHGHGDTCEAAHLLLGLERTARPAGLGASLKAVRARNSACVYLAP